MPLHHDSIGHLSFRDFDRTTQIIFSSSVWKTVEVIENEDRLIVELQHRDMGALGIKKRAVLADSQFFGIFRISHSAE